MKINCLYCNKVADVFEKEIRRGNGKFCSRSCSAKYQSKLLKEMNALREKNCVCSACGTKFYRNKSKMKNSKSGHVFCNRACKDKAQRIGGIKDIQPSHYGTINTKYRILALRVKPPKCENCGYEKYEAVLQVHHIDHNRANNSIENLKILCPTCHEETHFELTTGRWKQRSVEAAENDSA